jgi:hypothetical protein
MLKIPRVQGYEAAWRYWAKFIHQITVLHFLFFILYEELHFLFILFFSEIWRGNILGLMVYILYVKGSFVKGCIGGLMGSVLVLLELIPNIYNSHLSL